MLDRTARAPFAVLFRVELGANVLKLAKDLRNRVRATAEPAEREVRFARAAACPFAGHWELGDEGVLVGRDPACFAVAPNVDEEGLCEGAFGLCLI